MGTGRRASILPLAVLLLAIGARDAAPQRVPPAPPARLAAPLPLQEEQPLDPTFLLSAVVPGAAHYIWGDGRWVPYVALEAWGWISYVQQRRSGRTLERRYRDLAWQVARRISVGERRDTVFEYYESLVHYSSSGVFDAEPLVEGIQPEVRQGTFNGDVWQLAVALHVPGGGTPAPGSPGYDAALAYYVRNAVPSEYAWAWGASNLEQQVFAGLISESDAAFRSATRYLGLILANHIASTVDALVTSRLRHFAGDAVRFESIPVRDRGGLRWEHGVRIGF